MAELAIVIVSYNTRSELEECLASLHASPPRTSHEVVVVDNASTDGTVERLRTAWPTVRVIEAGANLGFAAANNIGIRATTSEFVVLLNSDTIVPAGAMDTLVGELRAAPEVAVVGPRLVDGSGRVELSFGRMMGPWNELRQKVLGRGHQRGWWPIVGLVDGWTRVGGDHDWVSGACLLVRREAAIAVGLLDEQYFLYAEDVDFCAAIRHLGFRVRFTPAAEVIHLRGRSGQARPAVTERLYRQSQLAFYAKHHPRWRRWLGRYLRARGKLEARDPPRPGVSV